MNLPKAKRVIMKVMLRSNSAAEAEEGDAGVVVITTTVAPTGAHLAEGVEVIHADPL